MGQLSALDIDYKKRCTELEEELSEAIDAKKEAEEEVSDLKSQVEDLEGERNDLQEQIDDSEEEALEETINCQSGGSIEYNSNGVNMRVDMIMEGLKSYLESGRHEQSLIDFLNT